MSYVLHRRNAILICALCFSCAVEETAPGDAREPPQPAASLTAEMEAETSAAETPLQVSGLSGDRPFRKGRGKGRGKGKRRPRQPLPEEDAKLADPDIASAAGALGDDVSPAWLPIDGEGSACRGRSAGREGERDSARPPLPPGACCGDDELRPRRETPGCLDELQVPHRRAQRARAKVQGADRRGAPELLGTAMQGDAPWGRISDLLQGLDPDTLQRAEQPDVGFQDLFTWLSDWADDMFIVAGIVEAPQRERTPSVLAANRAERRPARRNRCARPRADRSAGSPGEDRAGL